MGLNLNDNIINFFTNKMKDHSMVHSCLRTTNETEYVYAIERRIYLDRIKIWLSDAYIFSEMDFLNKPPEIIAGDYILIARPESLGWIDTTDSKIGIGKIGQFMRALKVREIWTYEPPTAEEREALKQMDRYFRGH